MRKFNAYEFYMLGTYLRELDHLKDDDTLADLILPLALIKDALQGLTESGQPVPTRVALEAAQDLARTVNHFLVQIRIDQLEGPYPTNIGTLGVKTLQSQLRKFETVFNAELASMETYWIEPKGIYSTIDLIEHAEHIFSKSVTAQLDDGTRQDINEAGRCIAFDLPTATAFHVWRAVERELRIYYEAWTGRMPNRKGMDAILK